MPTAVSLRNLMMDVFSDAFDGGTLEVATDGTFATILLTYTLANPFSGAASSGAVTPSIPAATATNSGNAEAFRLKNSGGTVLHDRADTAAISGTGGGGALVLAQATTAIVSGQEVAIDSLSFTLPPGP